MKNPDTTKSAIQRLADRLSQTADHKRGVSREKRHRKGYRTARENLAHLIDLASFTEYGQLAVAAQRTRRSGDALFKETACDGVITGVGQLRQAEGVAAKKVAVIINDYTVLAGTQGYFHHKKIDRLLDVALEQQLPVIMFTEGGGGRPGDTDVLVSMAGLNVSTFQKWAALAGRVPRVAVNNGFCFAGNAALFGAADVRITTRTSWIGMAGPAMIEGGGLGNYASTEIGPSEAHERNGVADIVADNEHHATEVARSIIQFCDLAQKDWRAQDQATLRCALPKNRRMAYDIEKIVTGLVDCDSWYELKHQYGRAIRTGFARIEGNCVALIASDCRYLAGAIDGESAVKCSEFLSLANRCRLPVVSLIDTPGFMVGPESEAAGAPRSMGGLFNAAASVTTKWVAVFLRRGYGLGAMALAGGSFSRPVIAVSWPEGEFGGMGLEGAVKLGYRQELEEVPEGPERDALFEKLLAELYAKSQAVEAASYLELDAVIDPADTRRIVVNALVG